MKLIDLQKQTATVTSAASITLGTASGTFRTALQAITAGDIPANATGVSFFVRNPANGAFESGEYTIGADGITLTQTKRTGSSNNGAAVAFGGVACEVYSAAPAATMNALLSAADGIDAATLTPVGSLIAGDSVILLRSGTVFAAPTSLLGSAAPADTTAPSVPTGLSTSGVTQTTATLGWSASTDNSGVAPTYETSRDNSSWVATSSLSYGFTSLSAGTLYTLQVRAVDGSGNRSAAASIQCTTAASTDTTNPVMAGSITTSSVTATSLTMAYSAGTDNVGVVAYEISVDTGTAAWVVNGTNLSYNAANLTAATTYTLRVRAKDAAGLYSNILTASITTSAAAAQQINVALSSYTNTVGTPFIVSGTWTGTQPSALDYRLSDDPAGQWTAAPAGTVISAGGTYSFQQTPTTTSAGRTISVRDRTTLVSGTSASYTVAAAGTLASQYILRVDGTKQSSFPANTTFEGSSAGDYYKYMDPHVNIVTPGGVAADGTQVKLVWGKAGSPCPLDAFGENLAVGDNGLHNGRGGGMPMSHLGTWSTSADASYGTFYGIGTWYAWMGTATDGTALASGKSVNAILWAIWADNSVKAVDNNTGTPVQVTLTVP